MQILLHAPCPFGTLPVSPGCLVRFLTDTVTMAVAMAIATTAIATTAIAIMAIAVIEAVAGMADAGGAMA